MIDTPSGGMTHVSRVFQQLRVLVNEPVRSWRRHSCGSLDLVGLGQINQMYGWSTGDLVLARTGSTLGNALNRDSSALAWTGDQLWWYSQELGEYVQLFGCAASSPRYLTAGLGLPGSD